MASLSTRLLVLRAAGLHRSPVHRWFSTRVGPPGRRNVLLMGAPGAGKTSVGRTVARTLGLPVIDVDDDVLETTWKMPVAAKLAAVGWAAVPGGGRSGPVRLVRLRVCRVPHGLEPTPR
ncbi:unnamed protein product [Pleuronectes platessa]|uniref:Shikimate kinase n=1 Tax=Pleuronectes platessa TaxID=8262 RepID=A0A9N7Z3H3_PLEPL|nr:unnamed protein product [Pleuronectes platessa]